MDNNVAECGTEWTENSEHSVWHRGLNPPCTARPCLATDTLHTGKLAGLESQIALLWYEQTTSNSCYDVQTLPKSKWILMNKWRALKESSFNVVTSGNELMTILVCHSGWCVVRRRGVLSDWRPPCAHHWARDTRRPETRILSVWALNPTQQHYVSWLNRHYMSWRHGRKHLKHDLRDKIMKKCFLLYTKF